MGENECDNEILKLKIETFLPWLEEKFGQKYQFNLEGLRERFVGIYTLFKLILEQVIEIDKILQEESQNQKTDKGYYTQQEPYI